MVIGLFADPGLIDPIFSLPSMEGKSKFHYRAVCNAQKMPVRFYLFFSCDFFVFNASCAIGKTFIMLYHQGNDPSTR